jgi:DNA-binding transcriptional LysR family regulator
MIQAGDADIGVLAGSDPLRFDGLSSDLYAIDRLVCVVANDHSLSGHASITLREMLAHDLVSVDRKSSNFAFLDSQAKQEGYTFNARVQAGVGLAIVPASVARSKIMEGRIQSIPIAEPWSVRHLYLVRQSEPTQKGLVQEFAQILLQDPTVVTARAGS